MERLSTQQVNETLEGLDRFLRLFSGVSRIRAELASDFREVSGQLANREKLLAAADQEIEDHRKEWMREEAERQAAVQRLQENLDALKPQYDTKRQDLEENHRKRLETLDREFQAKKLEHDKQMAALQQAEASAQKAHDAFMAAQQKVEDTTRQRITDIQARLKSLQQAIG